VTATADRDQLDELFTASPDLGVHAAATAVLGLALGTTAVATATFSLTEGLSTVLAALGLVVSVLGLARASRPAVAGTAMASAGIVLSLVAGAAYGLRYVGFDTALGDDLLPALHSGLVALRDLLPTR
jgi:hypothetical protein